MKTVIKTIVFCCAVIGALFISYKIYEKKKVDNDNASILEIAPNDPVVQLLMNQIYSSQIYRGAGFSVDSLDEETVMHYGIDKLTKNDYVQKTVTHKKSLCEVTGKILFTSNHNCNIRIIDNSYFTNLIKKDFNVELDLKYETFDYAGYFCKNDGRKYYCFLSDYHNKFKNFSVIDTAYEEGNKLIIYEYYLYVDFNNADLCNLYLNAEYCAKKNPYAEIEIADDVVINNGVLYRHEFVKEEDNYYYLQSFIVSER